MAIANHTMKSDILGTNDGGTVDDQFTYDAFDRRIGKLVGTTQYWTAYSGDNPYADFTGSTLTSRYLYGDGIDQLFARLTANPVTITWYLTDNVGSIRQLVDNAGAVQDTLTYRDSYGNNPSDNGTGDRFKFTGREYDSETGLYYYRARYYDPSTGRFLSQDPIRFAGGDSNLYRYVGNAPTIYTDPLALWRVSFNITFSALLQTTLSLGFGSSGVDLSGGVGVGIGTPISGSIEIDPTANLPPIPPGLPVRSPIFVQNRLLICNAVHTETQVVSLWPPPPPAPLFPPPPPLPLPPWLPPAPPPPPGASSGVGIGFGIQYGIQIMFRVL
jgi:RHS repeat-associated protein